MCVMACVCSNSKKYTTAIIPLFIQIYRNENVLLKIKINRLFYLFIIYFYVTFA